MKNPEFALFYDILYIVIRLIIFAAWENEKTEVFL